MQNKKRQTIYIVIFVITLGASVWVFTNSTQPNALVQNLDFAPGGEAEATSSLLKTYLPFGTEFDTEILTDSRFLELLAAPKLRVTQDELGVENPFSSQGVTIQSEQLPE